MGFETIVVATDLTEISGAAVAYARKLAAASGARLILAHGIDPLSYANIGGIPSALLSELTEKSKRSIQKLNEELLSEGIRSHSEVRQGAVVDLLLDVIRQYKADLLVVGTKGLSGAGPVLLGGVTEQLVRNAPCAVLAVAADALPEGQLEAGSNCVVPIERNAVSVSAIAAARSVAEQFGLGLLLVHARAKDEVAPDPCSASLEQIRFPMGESNVPVRCLVRDGSPAEVVSTAVEHYPTALIVIGVNRESRTGNAHGTAYEVMVRAKAPVLCIPQEIASASPVAVGETARC